MGKYFLTAFDKDGSLLVNESFEASNDGFAKEKGINRLKEEDLLEKTSRVVRSSGGLVYFHQ